MHVIDRRLFSFAFAGLALAGCTDDAAGVEDAADASIGAGAKADGTSWSGTEVAGALRTAAALTESELVADVGLTKRAAHAIVVAAPLSSLAALDAVTYIGPLSLARLVTYADAQGWTTGDMVEVAAGAFQMGDSVRPTALYQPLHEVKVSRFWLDRLEVTNADWLACVDDGACTLRAHDQQLWRDYETSADYADFPIVNIRWSEAQAYCEWAGKMLPTEAQWEKAARGTADTRVFPWGNDQPTCEMTNYGGHCAGSFSDLPLAVGTHPIDASPYGVLDMEGNVTEWVYDAWDELAPGQCGSPCVDPEGSPQTTDSLHSSRGGSFLTSKFGFGMAIHDRQAWIGNYWNRKLGFRCAVL